MNEMLNILTIWFTQVPVDPFGFTTVPAEAVSLVYLGPSVSRPKFLYEGKPLHIWTATGLAVTWSSMLMSGNWFVMDAGCWCCRMMKNRFLATGYWYWIQDTGNRMTDDWVYITDECGRFSISSWLIVALPQKTENHLKSPKFWRFQFGLIISYCSPQETTQTHIWNLHV